MTEIMEKYKQKYFANGPALRRQFGANYALVEKVYNAVVADFPEYADDVFNRLTKVKVRYKEIYDMQLYGMTKRREGIVGDNSSVCLSKVDFCERLLNERLDGVRYLASMPIGPREDLTEDEKKQARFVQRISEFDKYMQKSVFVHELIHTIAGVSMLYVDQDFTPISSKKFNPNKHFLCLLWGGVSEEFYEREILPENFIGADPYSSLIEEGIVEDWAQDICRRIGVRGAREDKMMLESTMGYQPYAMICGMWNAVSANQLRREFLEGTPIMDLQGQKTAMFKKLLLKEIREANPEYFMRKDGTMAEYDLEALADAQQRAIDLCDTEKKNIAHECAEKYEKYRSALLRGKALAMAVTCKCECQKSTEYSDMLYECVVDAVKKRAKQSEKER